MQNFGEGRIAEILEEYRVKGWEGVGGFAGMPPWELPALNFAAMCEYVAAIQAALAKVDGLDSALEERAAAYEKGGMGGRAAEYRAMVALIRAVRG